MIYEVKFEPPSPNKHQSKHSKAIAARWVLGAIALFLKLGGNIPHSMNAPYLLQERGDRGRVGVVEGGQCGEELQQEDLEGEEEVIADMNDKVKTSVIIWIRGVD